MSVGAIPRLLVDTMYFGTLEHVPPLRGVARAIAQTGSFALAHERRRTLVRNAGLALGPDATALERTRTAFRMWGSAQRIISEVLSSRADSPEGLRRKVARFDGAADYFAARRLRRGVVIASIHMGSFEPALATLKLLEPRINVLFHPDPMPRFERARSDLRTRLGVIEHRVSDGVATWASMLDALRADEAVIMHADRTMPGQRGVRMPFLGLEQAELPPGPLRLAATLGSPIVPTFCARTPEGIHLWCDGMIEVEPARLTAADVASHPAQRALADAMERAIRRYPDQWLAFGDLGIDPTSGSVR